MLGSIYSVALIALGLSTCTIADSIVSSDYAKVDESLAGFEMEYSRYLDEVSAVLDADDSYQKSVSDKETERDLSEHYSQISELTRSKLDELKRIELRRLKDLHKKSMQLAAEEQRENVKLGKAANKKGFPKTNEDHVDTKNPNSFGAEDLKKLIMKTTKTITEIDTKRRQEYKKHALNKAHMIKDKFRDLPPEEQQEKLKQHLEKAKKHERLNHPGNLKQLEEMWKKYDFMGGVAFDPKTFFMLRDVDGDGLLSPSEIEALFEVELNKLYSSSDADQRARDEDMNRMREHVFTEVDLDMDGMVSLSEFMKSTKTDEYKEDGSWQSVQDEPQFTDEELKTFEESLLVKDSP